MSLALMVIAVTVVKIGIVEDMERNERKQRHKFPRAALGLRVDLGGVIFRLAPFRKGETSHSFTN